MVNFAIDCGHLSDSLKQTCHRYSNQNRPYCTPPNPRKITGLSPTAQQELHCHGLALDWQILEAAAGPAMPTSASTSTIGAYSDLGSSCGNNPTVINGERDTQYFDPWTGRPFRFRSHARP